VEAPKHDPIYYRLLLLFRHIPGA